MIRPTTWIAAAVIATAIATPARADDTNEIRAVTYSEDGATTRIHVRGAQTPTFTVYKLERPSRVVVDVPRARLADALRGHESTSVFTTTTWAVSTIAAQQLDDGGQVVRVIVTLARPGRYDVKTAGNEVVVAVTARDPAPKVASADALAKAEKSVVAAQADVAKAQAEAERLRKVAAEQAARADAAQRAADEARKAGQKANTADLARAKAEADRAKQELAKANAAAAAAQADAERAKQAALADAAKAKQDAEAARQEVAATRVEADRAKQVAARETEAAKRDADAAKRDAEAAKRAADDAAIAAKREAELAKQHAARETEAAKRDAEAAKRAADEAAIAAKREAELAKQLAAREAEAAKRDLARVRAEAEAAKREAERIKAEAAATQAAAAKQVDVAAKAKADVDKARADAMRAKELADRAKAEAELARREAEQARTDAARTKRQADELQRVAEAARADVATTKASADLTIAKIRAEADAARDEAKRARADAEAAKQAAAADRKTAEAARVEADKMLRDAKQQLAALDKKMQAAQALEDKARAANAAAEARELVAREQVAAAKREREVAEQAAKRAADAAKQARSADRQRLEDEARIAEERLAKARRAAEEADQRRALAEAAAGKAKQELEQTRTTLASVEQQRTTVEAATTDAARKRAEAEAAATDATRRRTEAEQAVADAARRRKEAEQAAQLAAQKRDETERARLVAEADRKEAEQAARLAKAAAEAADRQRAVAEKAAREANLAKLSAEKSLDELTTRRLAAEHAAVELEQRMKAEAKAKAELAAAEARKADDAKLATARREIERLAEERKRAESSLADLRKQVASKQAETARLETLATQARDVAAREEARRDALAKANAQPARVAAAKPATVKPVANPVAKAGPKAKIADVAFKGNAASAQVDIAMAGDAKVTLGEVTARHVELVIDNAELAQKLERKLDVTRYGSPVKAVSSFRDRRAPDRIRLIAELSQPATPTIERDGQGIHWRFVSDDPAPAVAKQTPRTTSVPSPVVGGFGGASSPITQQSITQVPNAPQGNRRRIYRGTTVDFDFKDAPIHDLLRAIADTGRVNIVVPDNITARVTVRLKRVPWDQALEVILASHGLWYRREGNLYRIADRKELDKEDAEAAARAEAARKAETPRPEVIRLNYADASELAPKLQGMVSPSGTLQVDERQNALIINDVAGNRQQIAQLALSLDTQTPQISIEARIVEARSTFLRQFGIQWGGRAVANAAGGNSTGLLFPSSISLLGGNEDAQTIRTGVAAPSDFAINLPAATGSGEGGAIGLSLGSIGGNFALNLRLSALEDTGTVRIISAPKITVLNNNKAKITQGVSIPIQVISAAGTQTQLVQADLSLEVTPYVSPSDCTVQMKLLVTKNEPDFVNVGARGDPSFLRKEASTTMLVADGDTSVLGGIYTRNTGLAYKKLPFFGDIPVLGWFFKNRRENDDRTEILVFITPKITNKASLACK